VTENAYLVGLRLAGKRVVVIGGGTVAQRRVPVLIANGAHVHVVARAATPAVEALAEQQPGITLEVRDYRPGDLEGAWYAIAATDDPEVNAAVVEEADQRRIFCVRADAARDGSAVTPASFDYQGLLVGVLAGPLLGEQVRVRHWLALCAGFAGVLLIVRPGGTLDGIGVACALAAGVCYAAYQLLTRALASSEPPLRLLFYTALVGTLLMSPMLPITWDGRLPTPMQALLIASLGVYGAVGHFLLIRAFRESPASRLAPLLYMQLVWAVLLGWLIFAQWPDRLTIAGMLIIVISGLSSVWQRGQGAVVTGR